MNRSPYSPRATHSHTARGARASGSHCRPPRPYFYTFRSLLLIGALLGAWSFAGAARADKGLNDGVYRDREGKQHTWAIQRSHLLLWNEQPYAPAGVVFHSAFLAAPSAESFQKDLAELDSIKAAGVLDIWIDSGRGFLQNPVEQTQKLVDAVESRGFRYGLRIGDRSREPLIGFSPSLAPTKVPASRLQPGAREAWEIRAPNARRAVYALVDTPDGRKQNWAVAAGEVVVERDLAQIQVQVKRTSLLGKTDGLLLVVPEVQVAPEELGSFGDLWTGMESYAAKLKEHLQAVKFGPGLRFILDPFAAGDGTVGQEEGVFPSSSLFRTAFKEWLQKRGGIPRLNINWRTNDRRIPSLDEAARLVPMWPRNDPPEGDGWLIDPVDKVTYRCVPRQSTIWDDLEQFRAESLKQWMNSITTTLRQEGLNVPMLFTWSAYHPIFTNSPSPSGYDGLGAQVYGAAPTIGRQSAAYALAQAEESDRYTWLIATRAGGPPDASGKPSPLQSTAEVRPLWDSLREAGFRGLYLDPRQVPNAASLARDLGTHLQSSTSALQEPVRVCFFPMALATADRVTRLSNGVWWLPSSMPARLLRYSDTIMGYEIESPFGVEHVIRKGTVMWSTGGKQQVSLFTDKLFPVELYDSAGTLLKQKPKSNKLKVDLSEEPVVAVGETATLFPVELAIEGLREFDELLRQAEAQKLDSSSLRAIYNDAKKGLGANSASSIYLTIQPYIERLRLELSPYIWLEGEQSAGHNLTGIAFQTGTSAGTYLKLDRAEAPPSGVFRASYFVNVPRDATYDIWVAGRVPGRAGTSPLIWQVDEEPATLVKTATPVGSDYAPGMAWYNLGRAVLKVGRHELTLVVPEKAEGAEGADGRFTAGIDALVFARSTFQPKGIEKPFGPARAAK